MNMRDLDDLEVISRRPVDGVRCAHPLLFVHGAYAGAWCWDEHFLSWFAHRGYEAHALSLSGHGASPDRSLLDTYSIDDYVRDLGRVAERMPRPPVLIGHSMGGLVVQKYLERADAPAAVLLSSVPPQGLLGSAFGLALRRPALMTELNRLMGGGRVDAHALRDALFHQPVADDDLRRYLRASQPESHRAIWDMTLFNLPNPARVAAVPMLVLGSEHDELIPPNLVRMTASTYRLEAEILPDLGHGLMLERGWATVAGRIHAWLSRHTT